MGSLGNLGSGLALILLYPRTSPLRRHLVNRIALALANRHDHDNNFLVADFIHQPVANVAQLDFVAVFLPR